MFIHVSPPFQYLLETYLLYTYMDKYAIITKYAPYEAKPAGFDMIY